MAKLEDLTGRTYNRLTVIKYIGRNEKNTASLWECKCSCGRTTIVSSNNLKRGNTKSCGCYSAENASKRLKTHGKTGTPLFNIWMTMKARCYNPNNEKFKRYGFRGIKICDEWRNSFSAFESWSLTHGYKEGLSIDRIDNDGDYCPENCRWATRTVQANNTSTNVFITYNGEKKTATEWERILGMNPKTMMRRKEVGWSDKECIETPLRKCIRHKK